jgi:hypothetical protein
MNEISEAMSRFIARIEAKREDAARRGAKLPQDYSSIEEWHEDHIRSEPLPDKSNRRP